MAEENAVAAESGDGTASPMDGRSDSPLWELALRLVPQHYGPHGESLEPPRLWPGQLPDLPFELPMPNAAHLVGSYGRGPHLTILIDTSASPKETAAFYERRMVEMGWSTPAWARGSGSSARRDGTAQSQGRAGRSPGEPGRLRAAHGMTRTGH